jgi:hypothetical protein
VISARAVVTSSARCCTLGVSPGRRWKRPPANSEARTKADPLQPGQAGSSSDAASVTT